ncbi:MAG: hypothetical protein ACI30Y_02490 [Candidatus Limisoma sp.]
MNREERYTTVTLTINGESAKKTLEELSRKAEELGEKIRLIQGRGTRDEGRDVSPGNEGRGTGDGNSPAGNVRDTAAEVRRLEGELARVLGEIEAIESGAESVEGVMGRILQSVEQRKGLQLIGDVFKLPDWFRNKHRGQGVNIGGMTLAEAAELYRILSGIKSEVSGYGLEVRGGSPSATVNGLNGSSAAVNQASGDAVRGSAAPWRIDGGVIKVEMVNGDTLEIKDLEQLERLMGELMSQITDYKRLGVDYNAQNGIPSIKPDKFRVENDWKLEKDTENYIAMSTGLIDYKQYLERAREIEAEYLRMKIVNAKSTETEIYQFRNELLNLQVRGYRLEVREENKIRSEAEKERLKAKREEIREAAELRKKDIERQYQEGLIGYKAYREAMLRADVEYYEEVKKYYPQNSPYLFQIERNLYGKLQQERDRKAESFRNTQETMRNTYFSNTETRDVATIREDFDERARALDVLYNNMVELAKGDTGKLKTITKEYQRAKRREEVSRAKALGEDIKLTWREQIEEFMGWLDSDAGKKIMQTVGDITSSMSSIFQSVMEMAQIECEMQVNLIERRYKKEISYAEGNSYKVKKLEKQRDKEIAREKRKAAEKTYTLQVLMAIATTAQNAVTAYGNGLQIGGLAGLILAPIAAAMATAAGMVQIAVIKKQKEAAMSAEYAEGGFTPDGPKKKVVGVVHAGEWVASQKLVKSPVVKPLLQALDVAQKANVIGTLPSVQQVISATPKVIGLKGYGDENNAFGVVSGYGLEVIESNKVMSERLAGVISRLEERLEEPSVAVVRVTGEHGLTKAERDYARMVNNARPKSRRKTATGY